MVEVPLANGRGVALVDDEDAEQVLAFSWYRHEVKGKACARSSRAGYLHRFVCGLERGDGKEVDHRDGNGLDNSRSNLRVVTHAQNQQNRHRQAGRRSRHRGVSWWSDRGLWRVVVKVDGVRHQGGNFHDQDEAGRVAREMRQRLMPFSTT